MSNEASLGEWRAVDPTAVAEWFSGLDVPWWIAGGCALDLYLGEPGRLHEDLDVGVLRSTISTILSALPGWEIFEAKNGRLSQLQAHRVPRSNVHSLWCRRSGAHRWEVELMLEEGSGDEWVYRRCASIRRPFSSVTQRSLSGIPYLAPEVQLLYKAHGTRPRDQADFDRVVPQLSIAAQTWLREVLERSESSHPWISALRNRGA